MCIKTKPMKYGNAGGFTKISEIGVMFHCNNWLTNISNIASNVTSNNIILGTATIYVKALITNANM